MDKQHCVAGVAGCVTIGEREYRLAPLTLGDFAEIKAYLVSRRKSPLASLNEQLDRVDKKYHAELMRAALREACAGRAASDAEIDEYLQTFEGAAHLFWLMCRAAHPEMDSFDRARSVLAEYDGPRLLELQGLLDQATGFISDTALLGN